MTLSIRKNLLQSMTKSESLTNLKIVITKCERRLLQSVTGITKRANYDKVRRNNILNFFRSVL